MSQVLQLVETDSLPEIVASLDAGDLSDSTITLKINYETPLQISATDVDFAAGRFKFVFGSTSLVRGYYEAEICVEFGSLATYPGLTMTFQGLILQILPRIV